MVEPIYFCGPSISDKEEKYVLEALFHGWYDDYDMHIRRLEQEIIKYTGCSYTLITPSGTAALHLAALALNLKHNDEVICTNFSYLSTAYSLTYTGAQLVFVDIEKDEWCISPEKIERAITSKTKAIMLTHIYGNPAQMDQIIEIAKLNKLAVIEDAAAAYGSTFYDKQVGTFGDIGIFSFSGTKIANCGEGGAFITNNTDLYKRAKLLQSMGRLNQSDFSSQELGYKYKISNLAAAFVLAQLERIEEHIIKKKRINQWYQNRLKSIHCIQFIKERNHSRSNDAYPAFLLIPKSTLTRDELVYKLREKKIFARPTFPTFQSLPIYQEIQCHTPVADNIAQNGICLPSALILTENQIDYVCEQIIKLTGN